jgi:hypothetical protein
MVKRGGGRDEKICDGIEERYGVRVGTQYMKVTNGRERDEMKKEIG